MKSHRHTTATSTDAVESSTLNPSTTTDDERFLAEVSTTEVSTTGVSTTEMSAVGVSPDTTLMNIIISHRSRRMVSVRTPTGHAPR